MTYYIFSIFRLTYLSMYQTSILISFYLFNRSIFYLYSTYILSIYLYCYLSILLSIYTVIYLYCYLSILLSICTVFYLYCYLSILFSMYTVIYLSIQNAPRIRRNRPLKQAASRRNKRLKNIHNYQTERYMQSVRYVEIDKQKGDVNLVRLSV